MRKYNSPDYVEAFKNKDLAGIKIFYQETWPLVKNYIFKNSGGEEEAKDVMQNAISSLYTNIRSGKYILKDDTNITTYFLQICKYQWYDYLKSAHHRMTNSITEKEYLLTGEDDIHELMVAEEQRKYLMSTLSRLGARCQEILQLFYWEDYSLEEIARHYSFTKESAKNAKYRCLRQFKSLIDPQTKLT